MTLIPEGARHIRVAQSSHNYLGTVRHQGKLRLGCGDRQFPRAQADCFLAALVERDGRYVINGDGVPSPPGTYEAAGTRVVYTHGVGPEETLQASGPTSQELLLQVGGSGRFEAGHRGRLTGEAGVRGESGPPAPARPPAPGAATGAQPRSALRVLAAPGALWSLPGSGAGPGLAPATTSAPGGGASTYRDPCGPGGHPCSGCTR